ncbi:MAG: divergent polysaccharide deacetylase family protein [Holosporaceae bacterium]|jgi:polysaccharide deacetylase 2 family uncharacterized protein YibQ|nr:divergent polysaccharide deacetylase family protein [Holosporaceae bacterium]
MKKKLRFAWIVFLATLALFIALVAAYSRFRKERSWNYQYRILIDDSAIIETEETNTEVESKKTLDPDDKFYEKTKYGYLPKISADGMRPFDAYSACVEISPKKKLRVIVLADDLEEISAKLKLNNQKVTFVVPFCVDRIESAAKAIRENGHEFFIEIPTQSSVSMNKKQTASLFLANADINETLDKLFHLLASTKYAIGIANVSPTLFTKSERNMTAVVDVLTKRGLGFLDLEKSNDLLKNLAEKNDLIYINKKKIFEASGFDVSKLNDGDIVAVRLEHLNDFEKAISDDWLLTPVSASVRRRNGSL